MEMYTLRISRLQILAINTVIVDSQHGGVCSTRGDENAAEEHGAVAPPLTGAEEVHLLRAVVQGERARTPVTPAEERLTNTDDESCRT